MTDTADETATDSSAESVDDASLYERLSISDDEQLLWHGEKTGAAAVFSGMIAGVFPLVLCITTVFLNSSPAITGFLVYTPLILGGLTLFTAMLRTHRERSRVYAVTDRAVYSATDLDDVDRLPLSLVMNLDVRKTSIGQTRFGTVSLIVREGNPESFQKLPTDGTMGHLVHRYLAPGNTHIAGITDTEVVTEAILTHTPAFEASSRL